MFAKDRAIRLRQFVTTRLQSRLYTECRNIVITLYIFFIAVNANCVYVNGVNLWLGSRDRFTLALVPGGHPCRSVWNLANVSELGDTSSYQRSNCSSSWGSIAHRFPGMPPFQTAVSVNVFVYFICVLFYILCLRVFLMSTFVVRDK